MTDSRVLKTIIAEAGGDPAAMAAVAAVINNRAIATGKTPLQVVQQRNQFEGYSNPGPAISKQLNDAKLLARAEQAYSGVASGAIPDPTNGGTQFRAASASSGLHAPHGTVNIGGNVFAKGNSSPQTALSAINAVAPTPQSRPTSALGYEPQPTIPSVRAITVNPNGSPQTPQMVLPQAAMYGINRLDPNHVTHAPTDLTTQDVGVPDARLSQLSAPFSQPVNAFAGSRANGGASSGGLVSHPVQTLRIDPLTNQVISGNQPQSLQDALNVYAQRQALNTNGGSVKTTSAQAGNVALPKGVVPQQAAADLASITKPAGSAFTGGFGSSALLPHTAIPNQSRIGPTPSPVLAFNGDQNTSIPAPVAAITAATNPFGGAVANGALKIKPPTVPIPVIPASIGGKQPLTKYLPASQRQNDNLTTAGNVAGNILSATPAGHVWSLLTGAPNTGGGLLDGLFGYDGLLNSGPRMVFAPVAQQPLSPLLAQQSADQRGQAALQASGMLDSFGMVTGSGGHSLWGSH